MDDAVTWALQSVQPKQLPELKAELDAAATYSDAQLLDLWNGTAARYRFVEATSIRELFEALRVGLRE